jgi:pimeloyl-ACP methyl ester carboxylesterase
MTHAWPLNADIWDYQAARLSSAGFRVVTYDRRGLVARTNRPAVTISILLPTISPM